MNSKQIITIALAIVLLIVLYLTPINIPKAGEEKEEHDFSADFSFEQFQSERLSNLNDGDIEKIADLQTEIAHLEYPENEVLFDSLVAYYLNLREISLAADAAKQKAELSNKENDWLAAAELYRIELIGQQHRHPYYYFLVNQFKITLENALEVNPDNLDTHVDLAGLLMEDDAKVMDGVNILLGVVEKDSKHPEANLLLGRFGIVSGQYDRAISRLETVIEVQPSNAEAYFFLGEAYYASGKVAKAIEMFELCKSLIEDPEFERELENYIQRISKN